MLRSWYKNSCEGFLADSQETIIGALASGSAREGFEATPKQIQAWIDEIIILKEQLQVIDFSNIDVFLEFNIPRMGKRIDALLFIKSDKPHLVILEFKVGESRVNRSDIDQAMDYALELKNFHEGSHGADIFPVLVPTEIQSSLSDHFAFSELKDGIAKPVSINAGSISVLLQKITYTREERSSDEWEATPYSPTPTIIEAARALYSNHDVSDITKSEGSAADIKATSDRLLSIISYAKENSKKIIAFVTGVPGAGKTLVGLNMATIKRDESDETHAVFL